MDHRTRRRRRWRGAVIPLATAVATIGGLMLPAGAAQAAPTTGGTNPAPAPITSPTTSSPPTATPARDRLDVPDKVLAQGWQTSDDRAVTVIGDNVGLHVLAAEEATGYAWRNIATLTDLSADADSWIGQSCVTGSGLRAAVVYAPRTTTNHPGGMEAGGLAAIVDLRTGEVKRLGLHVSLAYFDPGCGSDENVAFTTWSTTGATRTTVTVVDAAAGKVARTIGIDGQLSSAVPMGGAVVAAAGSGLVAVSTSGGVSPLTVDRARPERLHADGTGGVAYQVVRGNTTEVHRFARKKSTLLGTATKGAVRLSGGAGGRVFVVGPESAKVETSGLAGWSAYDAVVTGEPSSTGALIVTETDSHGGRPANHLATAQAAPVSVSALVPATRKEVSFDVVATQPASASASAPPLTEKTTGTTGGAAPQLAGANDPVRGCAMSRNDETQQAYQATADQVEWAADLAVKGALTISRSNNFRGNGLPPYQIQGGQNSLFPLEGLHGGGQVPAQVLLGVLAQESNTLHASPHSVDGETGNFNQGGYYGDWSSWNTVDCGYGVGQITTGMAYGDTNPWNLSQQWAIATDYAANIAASTNMLIEKWNQLYDRGILANDGDPQYISNWYLAAWAYNTGVQPSGPDFGNYTGCSPGPSCTDNESPTAHWGLGWSNNPMNPGYPSDRGYFDANNNYDTKNPGQWPYQEKVMGWAATPVARFNYAVDQWQQAYAPAAGAPAIAPQDALCDLTANGCDPDQGDCTLWDSHCWWHDPVRFLVEGLDCSQNLCGIEALSFHAGDPEPAVPAVYPPVCVSGSFAGLPTGAKIIDDVETDNPVGACAKDWTSAGSFALSFPSVPDPNCNSNCIQYYGKIDFHQIGGSGFNGHLWFAHTVQPGDRARVTGTWTLTQANRLNGWGKVLVHIPKPATWTQQAHYVINTGSGPARDRYLDTHFFADRWVELGAYQFSNAGTQSVSLSNETKDGQGADDIAWDAVAFVPLSAKPQMVTVLGDSYISGEGAGSYSPETDRDFPESSWNACRRSDAAWSHLITLPGLNADVNTLLSQQDTRLDFQNVSCSGATAAKMLSSTVPSYWTGPSQSFHSDAEGQFGEIDQVHSGVLSADTDLVFLSAGGNDADFSGAVQTCAQGSCTSNESTYKSNINRALNTVSSLATTIAGQAPHANIVLVGYPRLFADFGTQCDSFPFVVDGIQPEEQRMMNRLAQYFRDQEQVKVRDLRTAGVHVDYVDMVNGFGDYGACQDGPPEYIHQTILVDASPDVSNGDFQSIDGEAIAACLPVIWCISRSSFHPKVEGYQRMRDVVNAALPLDRPSGAWQLREGAGSTAADASTGGHGASLTSTTWSAGPVLGTNAATFNGTSSYGATSAPVLTTNRSYTVSAWVRLTDTTVERTAVSQNSGTGNQSGFYLEYNKTANRWRFSVPASDSAGATKYSADSTAAPTTNVWTHLTGVYDWVNNTATLYVNGVAQGTVSNVVSFNATGALRLGRSGSTWWKGDLSDVRVFPYALSASSVADLATPPLVADFELNESLDGSAIAPYWKTTTLSAMPSGPTWTPEHDVEDLLEGGIDGTYALTFNGSNQYAKTTALVDTTKSFTVAAWVNLDDTSVDRTVASQNSATGNQSGFSLKFHQATNSWRFQVASADSGAATIYSVEAPVTNVIFWHHLVGVYDADAHKIAMYVDDTLAGTTSSVTTFNATGDFRIGRDGSNWWAGPIDAVQVYAGALTAAQISKIRQYV